MRYIAGRQHHLNDEQTTIGSDCLATMTKDGEALFLSPIVEDIPSSNHIHGQIMAATASVEFRHRVEFCAARADA